jgi:hypothetical protein
MDLMKNDLAVNSNLLIILRTLRVHPNSGQKKTATLRDGFFIKLFLSMNN